MYSFFAQNLPTSTNKSARHVMNMDKTVIRHDRDIKPFLILLLPQGAQGFLDPDLGTSVPVQ